MRPNILVISPPVTALAARELLRRQLAKEELENWVEFREQLLRENQQRNDGKLVCYYCGRDDLVSEVEDMSSAARRAILATIDHKVPLSKGGKQFDPDNCVVACCPCNEKKGNKLRD